MICKQWELKLTEVIGNVPTDGDFMSMGLKVSGSVLSLAKVDDLPLGQQQEIVKELIDVRTRLVDGQDDGATLAGELLDGVGNVQGISRGETRCRLVEEQDTGAGEKLDTDGDSTLFSSRYTADDGTSDLGVLDVGEVELLHDGVDAGKLVLCGHCARESHLGGECECLQDGQCLDEV